MFSFHWLHKAVAWGRGYSKDQLKCAFQIFLSFCIISAITFPSPIWNALSYDRITPPLALVLVMLQMPQHQGGVTLSAIYLTVGITLGGVLALFVKYLTYFANGSNWVDETVVKAVVYTLGISVVAGILNAFRWRWEITNQFFMICCAGLIISGGIDTYYANGLYPETMLYMLMSTALAAVVTVACCWFIFPVTAGSKYRNLVSKALVLTAEGISAYETVVLGPVDPKTGKLAAGTGKIDPCSGSDEGLTPMIDEIRKHLRGSRQCLMTARALNVPVRLEIDIYNTPKRFPYMEFMHTKIELSLIISTIATLTRPVKSGRIDLTLFQRPELRTRFIHLLGCLKTQFRVLAKVAQAQGKWQEADAALEQLDCAWIEFLDEAVMAVDGCTSPDAAFGLRGIAAFLYLVGSRTRLLYAALAGAVEGQDSEAIQLTIKRMEITPGWIKSADAFRNPLRSGRAALAAMQKAAAHVDNEFITNLRYLNKEKLKRLSAKMDITKQEKKSIKKALAAHKSYSNLIAAAHALGASPTRRVTHRVYKTPLPVIFGFQYAVAIGIAIALCVIPVVWQKGFHERPIDVSVTVAVTWQPNIGSVHGRALNRIFGTFLAAIWSYILLSLSYAASGGTWNDTPGKFIVAGFLAALWAGFCLANTLRYPSKQYGWLVAGFTVPVVTLTLLRAGPSPPWDTVAWRFLNVCMGVAIVWIVAFTVFPLSARTVVNANFSAALSSIAELLRQLPLHLTPADGEDGNTPNNNDILHLPSSPRLSGFSSSSMITPLGSPPSSPLLSPLGSPFGSPFSAPIIGTNAFRQAFLAPIHETSIRLGFRVQRALADVSQSIPALESEYLPFSKLHRVPQGATATAAHAAQLMLDFINITFALKMENSQLKPWRIPALQHKHMTAIALDVAQALDSLRDAVLGDQNSIVITLKLLDKVEEGIERQVRETLALAVAENDEAAKNGNNDVEAAAEDENPSVDEIEEEKEESEVAESDNTEIQGEADASAAAPDAADAPSLGNIKTSTPDRFQPTPNPSTRNRSPQLQLEVLVLLYLGISVAQQLKILCSATARAFLSKDANVVAEIDRKALETHIYEEGSDAENGSEVPEGVEQTKSGLAAATNTSSKSHRLEYLMARVLESTHSWPTSRSASSFTGADSLEATQSQQDKELIEVVTSAI